ncbi:hypothetical protein ABIC65_002506 [Sphingomonas trueperi]
MAEDAVEVLEEGVGGDAECRDAVGGEPGVAAGVVLGLVAMGVAGAVELDREAGAGAVEVEDIGTGFVLAAEVEAFGVAAEMAPEAALGGGHLASELAGEAAGMRGSTKAHLGDSSV